MKNTSTRFLGISELLLALIYLGLNVYSVMSVMAIGSSTTLAMAVTIMNILSVAVMIIASVSMLRNTNDRLTVISVILIGIFQLSIAIGVLFVLLLIKRKPEKSATIAKIWYVPIIVQALFTVYIIIMNLKSLTFLSIIINLLPLAHVAVLSNWLLRKLKSSGAAIIEAKQKQIDYYNDLLQKGTITQEEYNGYIAKIEEDFASGKTTFNSKTGSLGGVATTGNGQNTSAGTLFLFISVISVIIWIVLDIIWGFGFLSLLFK